MATTTAHTLVDGFCTVCGETREWLVSRGQDFTEAAPVDPTVWSVVDPAGKVHTRKRGAKVFTHVLIRRNVGSTTYFVNWASSEANARREGRVLADSREYIEVRAL